MTLPTLTRLNRHYAPLLNLARLLLQQAVPQLAGGALETFAFVFDMNRLFEGFLTQYIHKYRNAILPRALASAHLLPQAQGVQRYLAQRADGRPAFLLKPDLVVKVGEQVPLLVDMKYKRLDAEQTRLGVAPADFYQMLAYAHRYHCPRVLLLYPQTAEMPLPIRQEFHLHDGMTHILVRTVNLCQDFAQPVARQQLITELAEGFAYVHPHSPPD